jgi:hypothetical protein
LSSGIFGLHMPLLYGERGENAFLRLQKEVIKESHDHSPFALTPLEPDTYLKRESTSPRNFGHTPFRIQIWSEFDALSV